MTTSTAPNTSLNWPADGAVAVTAAVFFLAGEPPQTSTADYARIVRDELIAEAKRARGRAPAPEDRSALMQRLDKAWSALFEHARAGRLTLFGRPVDDILDMRKASGGIEKIPADRMHRLLQIDLRRNQLEPDLARADLSFGEFEALRHDRGFDLLRVPIAAVRSLMTPESGRQPKPQQVRDLVEGDPNRSSPNPRSNARIAEILTLRDFCQRYGVGRTRAYELIRAGAVIAVKVGRSTRITTESAERWLASLPVGLSAPLRQRRRPERD